MYPESDGFLRVVRSNTRKYYRKKESICLMEMTKCEICTEILVSLHCFS